MRSLMIAVVLSGLVVVSSGSASGAAERAATPAVKSPSPAAKQTPASGNVDIVYYFMTTQRCPSCMKIEAYTKEAVERDFAAAFKKGTMVWRMVNVDTPENNHFIKDYGLYTKSVVLVKMRNGKQVAWRNLDRVWQLLGDKARFQKYITEEVKKFVEKA